VAFDEDDLGALAHLRGAEDGVFDVAGLVAGGNDDGAAVVLVGRGLGLGAGDDAHGEAEVGQERG